QQFLLKTFGTQNLTALPAAGIGNDLLILVVKGDGRSIRLDGEAPADIARWHAVAVAIERQSEIFVDQSFCAVPIIRCNPRQSSQSLGLKAGFGSLSGFAMVALVRDLFEPTSHLRVDIG